MHQMAPVPYRPPPTHLIPQPSLIAPSKPVHVTSFIPRKLFLQLFAGTVCIFILGVLFWKAGRFFRFFTKGKVLREGNTTTARYTKTWYGWVSSQQHEANKRIVRNWMTKLDKITPWRSTKVDFHWVWWDPGQIQFGSYQERGKRWWPKWIKSYCFMTTDAIWNPGRSASRTSDAYYDPHTPSFWFAAGALSTPDAHPPMNLSGRDRITPSISLQEGLGGLSLTRASMTRLAEISSDFTSNASSHATSYISKEFISLRRSVFSPSLSCLPLRSVHCDPSIPYSISMPCLSRSGMVSIQLNMSSTRPCNSESIGSEDSKSMFLPMLRRSRKYQIWSARMGLQTLKSIGYSTHTLPRGPPGSPKSVFLKSPSFGSGAFDSAYRCRQRGKRKPCSNISNLCLYGTEQEYSTRSSMMVNEYITESNTQMWYSAPSFCSHSHSFHFQTPSTAYRDLRGKQYKSATKSQRSGSKVRNWVEKVSDAEKTSHCKVQAKGWSNWEARLMDNLDRRLDWLSNQLSPGKRTFHFALLANHWLNRETWIVYEPVSRVSIDMRRRLGDPRFNVPYPAPTWTPKQKYPKTNHRLAHTPRINSWRAAMNRHRRATGLKEFIKGIELYDSSAEDPPDGKVDPASWILRKPPQGFSLSARQKERYYEGGTGWQEKLCDWQKVRHGYRVRKAIYEGRVNRTRAKEIAHGISRYYRQATSRFLQSESGGECGELSTIEPS